ncbi:hypothetical protein LZ023_38270 (plasmid) [Pseudomonas silvicola]|nr:hypothetical protein LZ023_38270 [Pseudomonas silvicola]
MEKHSEYAVLRHPRHRKWFALVFPLEPQTRIGRRPGGSGDEYQNPSRTFTGSLRQQRHGVYPAYHMNRALDQPDAGKYLPDIEFFELVDESFRLTF